MLPNWESGPQNHPRAKVAVCTVAGASRSMDGITLASPDVLMDAASFDISRHAAAIATTAAANRFSEFR